MKCMNLSEENFCPARNIRVGNPELVCRFCPAEDKKTNFRREVPQSADPNRCRHMRKKCSCGRAVNDEVYQIRCLHPEASKLDWLMRSRSSQKCSIPLEPEIGLVAQFCPYYERIISGS